MKATARAMKPTTFSTGKTNWLTMYNTMPTIAIITAAKNTFFVGAESFTLTPPSSKKSMITVIG